MDPWVIYGLPIGAVVVGLVAALSAWRSSRAFDKRHPHLVTAHLKSTSSAKATLNRVPPDRSEG